MLVQQYPFALLPVLTIRRRPSPGTHHLNLRTLLTENANANATNGRLLVTSEVLPHLCRDVQVLLLDRHSLIVHQ